MRGVQALTAQQCAELFRLRAGIRLAQDLELVLRREAPALRALDELGVRDPRRRGAPAGRSVLLAYGSLHFASGGTILLHLQHRVLRSRPQDTVIPWS